MSDHRFLRTEQAAAYCASTASTFEKLRISGTGPAFHKIGHRVVYDVADLDNWLALRKRTATTRRSQSSTERPATP
jgi:predicted DNA-binding transcriptional regulator AlpA